VRAFSNPRRTNVTVATISTRCAATHRYTCAKKVKASKSDNDRNASACWPITCMIGDVMNPMAQARGLQLPRNDKGAASGCMTATRQNRSPAANAPSGAWMRNRGLNPSVDVGHFTLATFPTSNPSNVQLARRQCCDNRWLRPAPKCLEHTISVAQQKGDGAYPMPERRGLRARER
jgi:hypothetical protein